MPLPRDVSAAPSNGRLQPDCTLFLLCDVQERCRTAVPNFDALVTNTKKLVKVGELLDVPLIVSEQYPERFGGTVEELDIGHKKYGFSKTQFSMMTPELWQNIDELFGTSNPLRSVVLFGIEVCKYSIVDSISIYITVHIFRSFTPTTQTHVCIEQTAIELRDLNIDVHIVVDCSVSRSQDDRFFAFRRLQNIGCFLTTSENVIFKLVGTSEHPKFKQISHLVAHTTKSTGLSKL